jgi:hypothetical protein
VARQCYPSWSDHFIMLGEEFKLGNIVILRLDIHYLFLKIKILRIMAVSKNRNNASMQLSQHFKMKLQTVKRLIAIDLCNFFHPPVIFSVLCAKALNPCSSLGLRNQVLHPYRTRTTYRAETVVPRCWRLGGRGFNKPKLSADGSSLYSR